MCQLYFQLRLVEMAYQDGSLYLSKVEEQSDGIVEIRVGTASVYPQMPEHRKERGACQQHTRHQKDVPQNWNKEENV